MSRRAILLIEAKYCTRLAWCSVRGASEGVRGSRQGCHIKINRPTIRNRSPKCRRTRCWRAMIQLYFDSHAGRSVAWLWIPLQSRLRHHQRQQRYRSRRRHRVWNGLVWQVRRSQACLRLRQHWLHSTSHLRNTSGWSRRASGLRACPSGWLMCL